MHRDISEVDPLTAAAIGVGGALVGAGALKAKQLRSKAREKHGTVPRALHTGARYLTAKGLRKGAHKSSAKLYKMAKKLEKPLPDKRKNEEYDVKQDWQKTKSVSGQAVRDAGSLAKKAATGIGSAVKKGYQANLANRRRIIANKQVNKQQKKLGNIQRKKERVQAKHDLKLHQKRLKADQKLYKYDPKIH